MGLLTRRSLIRLALAGALAGAVSGVTAVRSEAADVLCARGLYIPLQTRGPDNSVTAVFYSVTGGVFGQNFVDDWQADAYNSDWSYQPGNPGTTVTLGSRNDSAISGAYTRGWLSFLTRC